MIEEFKQFIMRGNVIDMAVGIIVGAAFTAIVNSLVGDILTPIIGILTGGIDFSGLSVNVGDAEVKYGAFIQAVINFLIISFVIFMLVKGINTASSKLEKEQEAEEAAAEPSEEVQLLTQIRDELAKKN